MLRRRARNYLEHLNPFPLLFPKFYSEMAKNRVGKCDRDHIYTDE